MIALGANAWPKPVKGGYSLVVTATDTYGLKTTSTFVPTVKWKRLLRLRAAGRARRHDRRAHDKVWMDP